jgi:hypothetical protein
VDRALVTLVSRPDDGVDAVRTAMRSLSDTLLTHLAYEEEQLVGPLNRLSIGI